MPSLEAFRQGLRDLGYVEGQNLVLEPRWAEGSEARLRELAAELVQLPVDVLVPGIGHSQIVDERYFPQTQFRIDNDAFWDFFQHRGQVRTFGYPVSRVFQLDGFQVQIFQREVMQLQPDGGVQTLNLLDPGLMPYTRINGSTFPAPDPAVIAATPPVKVIGWIVGRAGTAVVTDSEPSVGTRS